MSKQRISYLIDRSPLYGLNSRAKLADILEINNQQLRFLSRQSSGCYSEFQRPKKNGTGLRLIENPNRPLKLVQARLARLLGRIMPPDYLFCPVKGRCYVRNAAVHRGNRVVHCLDVRKYYPSTKARRVFWFFRNVLHCASDIAGTLTAIACYKEHLPTGSPLSTILAYFAHLDVWETVALLCKQNGYTLSVYIDDVTVSAPKVSALVMWEIRKEIYKVGLRYHKEKLFHDRPAEITGIIVDGDKLNLPNRNLKRARSTRKEMLNCSDAKTREKLSQRAAGIRGQTIQLKRVANESLAT